MLPVEFPGARQLISALDAAVGYDCETKITDSLRDALRKLIRDPTIKLPRCCYEPVVDRYARRELYRSDEYGYSVVAMTWGPSQGTPIHDHCGMWCVESVWHGSVEITSYELTEKHNERYRFEPRGTVRVGLGSTGRLIPPHEYHMIRNSSDDAIAVTLHVYPSAMTQCSVFQLLEKNWHSRTECQLALDAMH